MTDLEKHAASTATIYSNINEITEQAAEQVKEALRKRAPLDALRDDLLDEGKPDKDKVIEDHLNQVRHVIRSVVNKEDTKYENNIDDLLVTLIAKNEGF